MIKPAFACKIDDWFKRHETLVGFLSTSTIVLFLLFTDEGNRMTRTTGGGIILWVLIGLVALNVLLFLVNHGWFYHCGGGVWIEK